MAPDTIARRFTVTMSAEAFSALVARARQERRHPSDEAAVLLERALVRLARSRPAATPEPRPLHLVGA